MFRFIDSKGPKTVWSIWTIINKIYVYKMILQLFNYKGMDFIIAQTICWIAFHRKWTINAHIYNLKMKTVQLQTMRIRCKSSMGFGNLFDNFERDTTLMNRLKDVENEVGSDTCVMFVRALQRTHPFIYIASACC